VALTPRHNTAILLDTDSVFHGVDRVDPGTKVAALRPGMHLCYDGEGKWTIRAGDTVVARYDWENIRFSISWKAYCFADEAERRAWRDHTDDLQLDAILDRLVDDLRARGRIDGKRPQPNDLALMMIDEYIRFPAAPVSDQ
jgi:hypothetical protein